MSSAKSVAKELIRLSRHAPVPDFLTYYRLEALAFYAQAWSLLLRDSELFPDDIACVGIGPIIPAIHQMENGQFSQPVDPASFEREPDLDDEDEALFLSYLWAAYEDLSPIGVLKSIHSEPSFQKAKQERERGGEGLIDMNGLTESFSGKASIPAALVEYSKLRKRREEEAEQAILSSLPLDKTAIWKDCRSRTPSATQQ